MTDRGPRTPVPGGDAEDVNRELARKRAELTEQVRQLLVRATEAGMLGKLSVAEKRDFALRYPGATDKQLQTLLRLAMDCGDMVIVHNLMLYPSDSLPGPKG